MVHLWTVICVDGRQFADTGIQAHTEEEAVASMCAKFGLDPNTAKTMAMGNAVPELSWQLLTLSQDLRNNVVSADIALKLINGYSIMYKQIFTALNDIIEHISKWDEHTQRWSMFDTAVQAYREFLETEALSIPEAEGSVVDFSALDLRPTIKELLQVKNIMSGRKALAGL